MKQLVISILIACLSFPVMIGWMYNQKLRSVRKNCFVPNPVSSKPSMGFIPAVFRATYTGEN